MNIKQIEAEYFLDSILQLNYLSYKKDIWTKEQYKDDIKLKYSNYYGLFENKQLLGYVHFHHFDEQAELINFAIHPLYQGKGLGFTLLKQSMELLQFQQCLLEVRNSNHSAISVYKKIGFEIISQRANYYKDPIEDALIMKWEDNDE